MLTSPPGPVPAVRPGFFQLSGIALGALALSLFFHSPHLWILLGPPMPGAACWARGLQFSLQCENPFSDALLDLALVWRLAPALLGHALHLRGPACFAIPWAGLLVLLFFTARLAWRLTQDLRSTWLFTALIGTTAVTLTVTGWLGFNDAWYAAALLTVAFQPQAGLLAAACLLGPWIDERFVLALPLAVWVHATTFGTKRLPRLLLLAAGGVALYLGVRFANPLALPTQRVTDYLMYSLTHFYQWLPWTALGWFMSLRAAWLLGLGLLVWLVQRQQPRQALLLATLMGAPLVAITLMATDTSRAPTMLLPVLFLGLAKAATQWEPARLRQILVGLLAANLLMPAMHVTYKYPDVINMLPVEIARLLTH